MKKPPASTKGKPPEKHTLPAEGKAPKKGDAHKLVTHDEKKVDGEVYPEFHEADVDATKRGKDLDSAASGEGMNLDFPNTALQDRYQPISPFRMRALGGGASGK